MFRNYLIIAWRNLNRQKAYSIINLSGLAVGITACLLIMLYVQNELSYDRYLEDHERIYRLSRSWNNADGEINLHLGHLAPPFSPYINLDYEGTVERSVRLLSYNPLVKTADKEFEEDDFFFADPEFLEVFSWKMLKGNPETALVEPYSVILTEEMVSKYFGEQDPMGQSLNINNSFDLKVTGVIQDIPENSHFHPEFFAPMQLVEAFYGGEEASMSAWGSNNFSTFVKLAEGVDPVEFEESLPAFIDRHMESGEMGNASDFTKLNLMNIADIHLHSHLDSEIEQNGDIAYVSLFAIIAIFILVIACINYVNLATARSAKRSREVGIRKVMGAFRRKLIAQFLTESMLFSVLALILAYLLVQLLLPWFNDFSQKTLTFDVLNNPTALYMVIGITLITGMVAGMYPALFLSSFEPAVVLKGANKKSGKSAMRSALVVFQFFISIVMLIGVGVVNDQLNYVKTKDLGIG